jgi:hypothetical protein
VFSSYRFRKFWFIGVVTVDNCFHLAIIVAPWILVAAEEKQTENYWTISIMKRTSKQNDNVDLELYQAVDVRKITMSNQRLRSLSPGLSYELLLDYVSDAFLIFIRSLKRVDCLYFNAITEYHEEFYHIASNFSNFE